MNAFAKNLKRLRQSKGMTQEQAADALGVSAQTVSRWECRATLPDVAMLPRIARLYCVTIDDLYRESPEAYENYAQRLGSVYEATRRPEDFLRAETEFRRLMQEGSASMEDLRSYGILCQQMMEDCRDRALSLFDRALARGPEADRETYWSVKRQKLSLLAQTGRADEAVAAQQEAAAKGGVEELICLLAAYQNAGRYQEARERMEKALAEYPENADLLVYGGNIYERLRQYADAFRCWEGALRADPSRLDVRYAMGFCYEKTGEYGKALALWRDLAETLESQGLDVEKELPQTLAEQCRAKLSS